AARRPRRPIRNPPSHRAGRLRAAGHAQPPRARQRLHHAHGRRAARGVRRAGSGAGRISLRRPYRRGGARLLRRRGPEGARRHDRCRLLAPALPVRALLPLAARLPAAADRGGQRRRLRRRVGTGALLRLRLRLERGPVRADGGDARHHAGRRRHPEPAPRHRRAPRQGGDLHRPALLRRGRAELGSRQPPLPAGRGAGGRAGNGARHPRQRADLRPPSQEGHNQRPPNGPRQRDAVRDRGLLPVDPDRRPFGGDQRLRREAQASVQRAV
ncbi:MAG: Enoyl-CoA hydratase, partial [uncultured Acetobacteraceae bacterium]